MKTPDDPNAPATCRMPDCTKPATSAEGLCRECDKALRAVAWDIAEGLLAAQRSDEPIELPPEALAAVRARLAMAKRGSA